MDVTFVDQLARVFRQNPTVLQGLKLLVAQWASEDPALTPDDAVHRILSEGVAAGQFGRAFLDGEGYTLVDGRWRAR